MLGMAQRGNCERRVDRGQPAVACANTVAALVLQVARRRVHQLSDADGEPAATCMRIRLMGAFAHLTDAHDPACLMGQSHPPRLRRWGPTCKGPRAWACSNSIRRYS